MWGLALCKRDYSFFKARALKKPKVSELSFFKTPLEF